MNVGIIGGGITGLTTALALQKFGLSSIVFEQARQLNEVGAGIWIQPNAMKVLNWLEIGDRIKEQGNELKRIEITDSQLIPFKKLNKEMVHADDKIVAIHRAELQNILFQEVQKNTRIYMDRKYVSHETNKKDITIKFEDGTEAADLLLGADGINSQVRKSIAPKSILRNSGQLCWRGISNFDLPDSFKQRGIEAWGKQIRFGFSRISPNKVYWFAVAKESQLNISEISNKKEIVADLFREFSSLVKKLIANTHPDDIHQAVLQDLKKINTWYGDKVCLLGDAAHATTPNMGQGACQGVEDAYYISKFLSESNGQSLHAFKQFEKKRIEKVDYVVNTSWRFGKMAHSMPGQAIMKLLLKLTPEHVIQKQMERLYHVDF